MLPFAIDLSPFASLYLLLYNFSSSPLSPYTFCLPNFHLSPRQIVLLILRIHAFGCASLRASRNLRHFHFRFFFFRPAALLSRYLRLKLGVSRLGPTTHMSPATLSEASFLLFLFANGLLIRNLGTSRLTRYFVFIGFFPVFFFIWYILVEGVAFNQSGASRTLTFDVFEFRSAQSAAPFLSSQISQQPSVLLPPFWNCSYVQVALV